MQKGSSGATSLLGSKLITSPFDDAQDLLDSHQNSRDVADILWNDLFLLDPIWNVQTWGSPKMLDPDGTTQMWQNPSGTWVSWGCAYNNQMPWLFSWNYRVSAGTMPMPQGSPRVVRFYGMPYNITRFCDAPLGITGIQPGQRKYNRVPQFRFLSDSTWTMGFLQNSTKASGFRRSSEYVAGLP